MNREVCKTCGGTRPQHFGDVDGCWCRGCLRSVTRCMEFLPVIQRNKPEVDRLVAPVGHAHPETAKVAAAVAKLRSGTQRKTVFEAVQRAGSKGVTDDELEQMLLRSHQSISATRNSLMTDGLIVDSGLRRQTRFGNAAICWIVAGNS